jgi:hypothetical protein
VRRTIDRADRAGPETKMNCVEGRRAERLVEIETEAIRILDARPKTASSEKTGEHTARLKAGGGQVQTVRTKMNLTKKSSAGVMAEKRLATKPKKGEKSETGIVSHAYTTGSKRKGQQHHTHNTRIRVGNTSSWAPKPMKTVTA